VESIPNESHVKGSALESVLKNDQVSRGRRSGADAIGREARIESRVTLMARREMPNIGKRLHMNVTGIGVQEPASLRRNVITQLSSDHTAHTDVTSTSGARASGGIGYIFVNEHHW
jgi:hypothetical protein